jgi:hypothetical protein
VSTERQVLPSPPKPKLSKAQERVLVILYRVDALFGGLYLHRWLSGGRARATLRALQRLGLIGFAPNSREDWDDRPLVLTHAGRERGWDLAGPVRRSP